MEKLRECKECFIEIILVIKACLTTIWFWIPVIFASYFYLQLWMIFSIHPLTILIGPLILSILSLIYEEKRIKAQYALEDVKLLRSSNPLGAPPRFGRVKWDVEKAVREYEKSLEEEKEN